MESSGKEELGQFSALVSTVTAFVSTSLTLLASLRA